MDSAATNRLGRRGFERSESPGPQPAHDTLLQPGGTRLFCVPTGATTQGRRSVVRAPKELPCVAPLDQRVNHRHPGVGDDGDSDVGGGHLKAMAHADAAIRGADLLGDPKHGFGLSWFHRGVVNEDRWVDRGARPVDHPAVVWRGAVEADRHFVEPAVFVPSGGVAQHKADLGPPHPTARHSSALRVPRQRLVANLVTASICRVLEASGELAVALLAHRTKDARALGQRDLLPARVENRIAVSRPPIVRAVLRVHERHERPRPNVLANPARLVGGANHARLSRHGYDPRRLRRQPRAESSA